MCDVGRNGGEGEGQITGELASLPLNVDVEVGEAVAIESGAGIIHTHGNAVPTTPCPKKTRSSGRT